jgi:16S rRNA (cytidine1402-2'-O)-methyltransferase
MGVDTFTPDPNCPQTPSTPTTGKLSICATPIGNIKDITLRVLEAFKEADLIYAEDTRVTRKLLSYYDIHTFLERADEHALPKITPKIIEHLDQGKNIAYATDAGMPGISDPGLPLINAVRTAGLTVEVLPGASALTGALAASGFKSHSSFFGGFLPRKAGKITRTLQDLANLQDTVLVFYESVHRTHKTLTIIAEVFPDREVAMVRELTKLHEEVLRGLAPEVAASISQRIEAGRPLKGEVVILIGPLLP